MKLKAPKSILMFLLIASSSAFSQQNATLERIRQAYGAFEYRTVIQLVDSLLLQKDSLPKSDLIVAHLMRGTACFSLGDEAFARRSFFEILLVQNDYKLDSARISPKIISLFEDVRGEFLRVAERKREPQPPTRDTVKAINEMLSLQNDLTRKALLRSLVLPGWGHLYREDETKGWMLTSASVVTLGSMVYFILESASREKAYLNESDPALIEGEYDRYNSSYKIRNALIVTYAAVWVYAQLDLLLFSPHSDGSSLTLRLEQAAPPQQDFRLAVSFRLGP